jgi:glycosyltransferase involved in cell wall biosynthesis
MTLAVVILTFNEAAHIGRAIDSVRAVATELFVIDSGSTDDTVAIAEAAGATVLVHPFTTQAQQFQWALDQAPITADWVMRLDADEVVEPALAAEIAARLPILEPDITGVNLRRKHVFMGRWIRHGGRWPLTMLRLWRRGAARVEQRWMDEHMVLTSGRSATFDQAFADANLHGLGAFTAKHNGYAAREAIDVLSRRYGLGLTEEALDAATGARAAGKRRLKQGVYERLPLWLGPLAYFLYRYVIQLGFLDGREGLIYHALQGGWYRFLVAARVEEFDRALRPLVSTAERRERLLALAGFSNADGADPDQRVGKPRTRSRAATSGSRPRKRR